MEPFHKFCDNSPVTL